jgi:hypothetical protein
MLVVGEEELIALLIIVDEWQLTSNGQRDKNWRQEIEKKVKKVRDWIWQWHSLHAGRVDSEWELCVLYVFVTDRDWRRMMGTGERFWADNTLATNCSMLMTTQHGHP